MQFQKNKETKPLASSIPSGTGPRVPHKTDAPLPSPAKDTSYDNDDTVLQPGLRFTPVNAPDTIPGASKPDALPLDKLEMQVLGMNGSNNRKMFIEHLFGGSRLKYEQLLRQLNGSPNWAQASQLIANEVFKKNQVNIYSPAAIMFTESVEDQFR
jgi:hypothetical protein